MRIIAGDLRGRNFDAPRGHRTHPMSEKARGALFNALGDITGLGVLDAFTGSGALSFEALSRGARHATMLDIDKGAITTVVKSAQELGVADHTKAVRANSSGWSDNNSETRFDLVFCDPPYDQLQERLINKLTRHVAAGGLLILSWPGSGKLPELDNVSLVEQRSYGDSQLGFYRR